jgi:hypothetical protein
LHQQIFFLTVADQLVEFFDEIEPIGCPGDYHLRNQECYQVKPSDEFLDIQ